MRFILVDQILELVAGVRVKAIKRIATDEDYFTDHFPGFPVVPGVLLTEMMGQASAKCLVVEKPERGLPMLAQIKSASFRDWVRPGQVVTLCAEVRASREQFATVVCHADVDGKPVASAELFFTFVPASQFASGYRDEVLNAFLEERSPDANAEEKQSGD